ncbi:MAG: 50S ribosomal protein L19e [Nanoarchaeota archaeon]
MRLTSQRRIAAQVMKCGQGRVWFDNARMEEIKQAITKADIRHLIHDKAIQKRPKVSISHGRFRKNLIQKRKGRQRGMGSRKGKKTARKNMKQDWAHRIRIQRGFLKLLRDKELIKTETYHMLYKKAKGGFFRSKRHIKLYLEEHKLGHHETQKKTRSSEKKT